MYKKKKITFNHSIVVKQTKLMFYPCQLFYERLKRCIVLQGIGKNTFLLLLKEN